jgi:hypothetical protein
VSAAQPRLIRSSRCSIRLAPNFGAASLRETGYLDTVKPPASKLNLKARQTRLRIVVLARLQSLPGEATSQGRRDQGAHL